MAVSENPAVRPAASAVSGAAPRGLITAPECPAEVSDAYDALLTKIDVALGPNAGTMVAFAAVDESANAALVAANLAIVAAGAGDRTLLVDCDLQHPGLHQLFGADAAPGMAQLLSGEHNDLKTLAQPSGLPLLGIIPAGVGGMRHGRLARFGDIPATLLRLKNAADRVFLVTAPALSGTDVLRLAAYIDGIVLVVTPGRTRRESAGRVHTVLEKAEAPVLGVVLAPGDV